jgi:hypothetical protein
MGTLSKLIVVALLLLPAVAHADLVVTIQDGSTTVRTRSRSAPAGQNHTLFLLSCATPPCTETLGGFVFQDLASDNRARIVKADGASVDKLELRGLRVRALSGGRTLRIVYSTDAGDLTSIVGGTYPYTAVLAGSFTSATGVGPASACVNTSLTFCVQQTLIANGNTVNLSGSESIATVSVPPISTLSGVFPTGLSDTESIPCGTPSVAGTCQPALRGRLTARFDRANETLVLPGSATNASANQRTQEGGEIAICADLTDKLACGNRYIAFTAAGEDFRAVFRKPESDTRNVSNLSTIPFAVEFLRPASREPAESLPLIALGAGATDVTDVDADLGGRSFLGIVPGLRLRDLHTLAYRFAVTTDDDFSDCEQGSLHVLIEVTESDGTPVGTARVLLGSPPDFRSGCSTAGLSDVDLVDDRAARVDTTGLPNGGCCTTFSNFQNRYGSQNRRIRAISLVLEKVAGLNQKTEVFWASVNGVIFSPTIATDFTPVCDHPAEGTAIRVTKLTGPDAGYTATLEPLESIGCQLRIHAPIGDLQPDVGGTDYRAELTLNGRILQESYFFSLR